VSGFAWGGLALYVAVALVCLGVLMQDDANKRRSSYGNTLVNVFGAAFWPVTMLIGYGASFEDASLEPRETPADPPADPLPPFPLKPKQPSHF
jgi:hypothetical protein